MDLYKLLPYGRNAAMTYFHSFLWNARPVARRRTDRGSTLFCALVYLWVFKKRVKVNVFARPLTSWSRGGYSADLLQQARKVWCPPMLNDLSVHNTEYSRRSPGSFLATGENTHKWA